MHQLLHNNYKVPYFENRFADTQKYPTISNVLISIGVQADLSQYPHSFMFKPSQEVVVNGKKHSVIMAKHYAFDPVLSPPNSTLVECMFLDYHYDYWEQLRNESEEAYQDEKGRIGALMLSELQKIYPETEGKVQLLDVATPLTYHRYCNAYRGAYMSFLTTPKVKSENHSGVIAGLDNLFLASQWVMPSGGLPIAALAGKFAIQRICKQEKIDSKF